MVESLERAQQELRDRCTSAARSAGCPDVALGAELLFAAATEYRFRMSGYSAEEVHRLTTARGSEQVGFAVTRLVTAGLVEADDHAATELVHTPFVATSVQSQRLRLTGAGVSVLFEDDLSGLALSLAIEMARDPRRLEYHVRVLGGMFSDEGVRMLDQAYGELLARRFAEPTGSIVSYFGVPKAIVRLTPTGLEYVEDWKHRHPTTNGNGVRH